MTLTTAPVLAFYDVTRSIAVSADTSGYGGEWKAVADCSWCLTEAETHPAQIEKEYLASVWACEKFDKYLCGLDQFRLDTDHKPLVALTNSQSLDNAPLRCQRLLMRLLWYNAKAEYVPGKTLIVADTLSRNLQGHLMDTVDTHEDGACYVAAVLHGVLSKDREHQNGNSN